LESARVIADIIADVSSGRFDAGENVVGIGESGIASAIAEELIDGAVGAKEKVLAGAAVDGVVLAAGVEVSPSPKLGSGPMWAIMMRRSSGSWIMRLPQCQ
jgi:hypothetical protein